MVEHLVCDGFRLILQCLSTAASYRIIALWVHPGDLTCLEDCPDVCVQNRGKWVPFLPKVREWRDPLNGCQISQAPLYGYIFEIYKQRDVLTIDILIYFDLSQRCSFNLI